MKLSERKLKRLGAMAKMNLGSNLSTNLPQRRKIMRK
jgi:hypothetical protein